MSKRSDYKQALENHDDPRYTFEHWEKGRFYPTYAMSTDDIRNLRKEYKSDDKISRTEKISDRAIIIYNNHGSSLKSYYTNVCCIINGTFYKTWQGYSATTMKHINEYRHMFNIPTISKYEWIMMETYDTIIDDETGEVLYEA